jgi:hypothetical protein
LARFFILTLFCLVAACSGDEKPPLVQPINGGKGGGAGEAGEGPTGGTTASGGSGGTGNVGGLGSPDPDEIYVLGTLELGNMGVPALFHWGSPEDYAAGFDAAVNVFRAKVGEAGLLYQLGSSGTEIRRFVSDLTSSLPLASIEYPDDAIQNDPVVAELDCPSGGVVLHFVVGPADRIVNFCGGAVTGWFESGELVWDGTESMLALGYDDLAVLTDDTSGAYYVANLASGERTEIVDIGRIYAVRAIGDGFLVAGVGDNGDELFEVSADGEASSRGVYTPREPPNFLYFWALEPDGTLYELDQVGMPETIMTRRRVGGENEIVLDDYEAGTVFIGGNGLATGP